MTEIQVIELFKLFISAYFLGVFIALMYWTILSGLATMKPEVDK